MRAAERADARDRALVVLMVFTAVRIGEAVALDVRDLRISPRNIFASATTGSLTSATEYRGEPYETNGLDAPATVAGNLRRPIDL